MTVYIEKPAVNLREELASLRNQGGYEERQFYFDGLVTNGTFDVDANWTKEAGWTISGGVATCNGSSNNIYQNVGLVSNERYAITFTISAYTSGSVRFNSGSLNGTSRSALGTYVEVLTATNSTNAVFDATSFVGSIDNVSIFKVDANDDVVHRMPKGWVPLHVYEDGLLQREGAAHDYEVVYDGFDYYVKPAVAPGATTETCVIGVRK